MQFSEHWLRTWINPAIDRAELVRLLTGLGHELDAMSPVAGVFMGVCVGLVLSAVQHPDADRLRVCTVQVEEGAEPLQIVCGAANARAGLKVAVAQIGAELDGGQFKIKRSRLRGVESQGMLCSASELGLAETSEGILELSPEAPLGQDLRVYLDLDDVSIRLDLTPNRGDCLSVRGIARELSLKTEAVLQMPFEKAKFVIDPKMVSPDVQIEDKSACGRYLGRLIQGIDNQNLTPLWMQERLRRSGLRSISPVVDVGNYVMLELGQPLHAFDAAKLQGTIQVRKAKAGEQLQLLDGKTIQLDPSSLVISDEHKALALAGVMGGQESAVSADTSSLFLESAFFTPLALAAQARRYGLHSDAAHRFERGVDPELAALALERATDLLISIVGGQAGPVIEQISEQALPKSTEIKLRAARIKRILGIEFPKERVSFILKALGMQVAEDPDGWRLTVPSFRSDLSLEIDLIEELARVQGYEHIPNTLSLQTFQTPKETLARAISKDLSAVLIARDYQELVSYSFVDPNLEASLFPDRISLKLANPISPELSQMRTSLWPGLLRAAIYNQNRQQERLRFYEWGVAYQEFAGQLTESSIFAGLVAGPRADLQWGQPAATIDFFDLKADVEALLGSLKIAQDCDFRPQALACLHPGQSASIYHQDRLLGHMGALHPDLKRKWDLKGEIFLFELDLQPLKLASLPRFATLSKYPAIRRDLAFTLPLEVDYEKVKAILRVQPKAFEISDLKLFDVYQGPGVAAGEKSFAVALILQHPDRTLVDDEVNAWLENRIQALSQELGAVLRR